MDRTTALAALWIGVHFALASAVSAQFVTIAPNPSSQVSGQPTLQIIDTSGQGLGLPSQCTWFEVRAGSQTGPLVPQVVGCPALPINVPPNGSFATQWNQLDGRSGQRVPAGRYWIQTRIFTASGAVRRDWFCHDVLPRGAVARALVQFAPALVGANLPLTVFASNDPGAPYATLLSFTQNQPLAVPGLVNLCLSAPLFLIDSGTLDSTGRSARFQFPIPNDPSLSFVGVHLQSVIVDSTQVIRETSPLSVLIR